MVILYKLYINKTVSSTKLSYQKSPFFAAFSCIYQVHYYNQQLHVIVQSNSDYCTTHALETGSS